MRPTVLCFSGLDPSGGAGLQADIEAIGATGSHAAVCCTALTIQDSQHVYGFSATPSHIIAAQAKAILADLPIKAFKSGMMGNAENVNCLQQIVRLNPHIPYILDPVLAANSGDSLGDVQALIDSYYQLIPLATLLTPNTVELNKLTGCDDINQSIKALFKLGAKAILVKGAHLNNPYRVVHTLYVQGAQIAQSVFPRLAGEFHGSGCTLASSIAGFLAQGMPLQLAIQQSELWVQRTLQQADNPHPSAQGKTYQKIPKRFNSKL